jgi:CRP/FNR family transcriptional regulator, cyclic AMP receptor protein
MENSKIKEQLDKLRGDKIFSLIDDDEAEKIAPFFELTAYPAKTVVFKEGEPGDFIGIVLSGKLAVKKKTEFKGNQVIIALLGRGALLGELSIFDKHARSATVETVDNTTILMLRNNSLSALIQQYPYTGIKILKSFIRILSLRLREVTERLTAIF